MFQVRHGDLLLTRVSRKFSNENWMKQHGVVQGAENDRLVLLRGERTGHAHTVEADKAVLRTWQDLMQLEVKEETDLTHEEHAPIRLEPGIYEVRAQRRFDYENLPQPTRQAKFD